jgi:integrase
VVQQRRDVLARIASALSSALRPLTRHAYLGVACQYLVWCQKQKLVAFPATGEVAGAYVAMLARLHYKRKTIQLRIAVIAHIHRSLGYAEPNRTPVFQRIWKGIRRSRPADATSRRPLTMKSIKELMAVIPHDLRGLRDRAFILTGFAGAMMSNELRLLKRSDIVFDENMIITIGAPRSRTIHIGPGLHPATCPVQAMREWLEVSEIHDGPVFRKISVDEKLSDTVLGHNGPRYILKRRCKEAGLRAELYGLQSLRSGFYLTMAEQNVDVDIVAGHAGIKDVDGLNERHFKRAYRWADAPRSVDEQRPKRKIKWHE